MGEINKVLLPMKTKGEFLRRAGYQSRVANLEDLICESRLGQGSQFRPSAKSVNEKCVTCVRPEACFTISNRVSRRSVAVGICRARCSVPGRARRRAATVRSHN
jgi:hypothetical protein